MKTKKSILLILLLCLACIGCLSIKKQTIDLEKKEIESKTISEKPKFSYALVIENIDSNEKIEISIHGTQSIAKIKETKYSVHQVEERKIDGIDKRWDQSDYKDKSACFGIILSPILIPIDLIKSIDKDLGNNEIVQNEPLPIEINNLNPNGILRINEGTNSIEIPIVNGSGNLTKKNILFESIPQSITFIDKDNKQDQDIISEDLINLLITYSNKNKLFLNGGYNNIPWGITFENFSKLPSIQDLKMNKEKSDNIELKEYDSDLFLSSIMNFSNEQEENKGIKFFKCESDVEVINYIFLNNNLIAIEKKFKDDRKKIFSALTEKYKIIKKLNQKKTLKVQNIFISLKNANGELLFTYESYDTLLKFDDKTQIAFIGNLLEKTKKNDENLEIIKYNIVHRILEDGEIFNITSDISAIENASIFYYSKKLVEKKKLENIENKEKENLKNLKDKEDKNQKIYENL